MCYPSPPAVAGLANGAFAAVTFELEGKAGHQNALTQAVIKLDDTIIGITYGGAVYAEMWLVRGAGSYNILLDKGFVHGGAPAHVVGMTGNVMFTPGDTLVCKIWNDSGAAFPYKCQYSTDYWEDDESVMGCGSHSRLSTRWHALWVYGTTILNDGANAGNQIVKYQFADGLAGKLLYAGLINMDTVARGCDILLAELAGTVVWATLALNAGLAASATLNYPTGTTYIGIGIELDVPPSLAIWSRATAIAVSQDTVHLAAFRIESRPPTVTVVAPTGAVSTPIAGYNEVR